MRCVRIWFDKLGDVKYISHLDLMRCFTRAMRRAKIPLWYTEGFNPHPYMQFALPLSLGMQSVCESVDIRIEGDISDTEILEKLKATMPVGINIKGITEPKYDPKKITYGDFSLVFSGSSDPDRLEKLISDSLKAESFIVEKLGKKGRQKVMKQIDLKEHIRQAEVKRDGEDIICQLILPAGSTVNINPSLFSDKIIEIYGEMLTVDIMRNRLLIENMKEFK